MADQAISGVLGSDLVENNQSAGVSSPREAQQKESTIVEAHNYDLTTTIKPLEGWRLFIVNITLCLGLFLAVVETSITATALVSISEYFNDSSTITWVVLGYLLSYMGFSIIFARVSDAIGRKSAVLAAFFLFATFSLASGLATSLGRLIVFRIIQGVGGSGLYSMTMIVLPQVTPARYWGIMSGLIGGVFVCSSILGPVLGGVITERATWRWIYLFNAPVTAVIIPLFIFAWPKNLKEKSRKRTLLFKELDFFGALLLLAASTLLVFALQQAGSHRYEWGSGTIIASLVMSGLSWVGFVVWVWLLEYGNSRLKMKAIFPVSLVIQRPVGSAILMAFLTGMPFFVVIINLPTRFQIVNGDSPILSGVHILPLLGGSAVGSGIGGVISSKKNLTSYSLVLGACLMTIGSGLLSTLKTGRDIEDVGYVYQCVLGLGIGIGMASLTLMVAITVDFDKVASAQGAVNQARVLGGSIGLAIATILLNHLITKTLSDVLTTSELENVQNSVSTVSFLTPSQQILVAKTYGQSFNDQMRLCLGVSAASILVAVSTWQKNPVSVQESKRKQHSLAEASGSDRNGH
ncbi:major facilitator superfamily domain-containing protein [Amylocarpus encephaloides]|uniref:Major facilitator superfamily domain-containing protein n=1 Tax=Amylocarpus encephaloides TaxID=45428 RepID=A0A9P7YN24_9HELO|nr:major facilitator superfamily domain-containing protein [Amylocarpus encephaloides]